MAYFHWFQVYEILLKALIVNSIIEGTKQEQEQNRLKSFWQKFGPLC